MIWVTDVRTLPDYRMWVRFSDATDGEIDLKCLFYLRQISLRCDVRRTDRVNQQRDDDMLGLEDSAGTDIGNEVE